MKKIIRLIFAILILTCSINSASAVENGAAKHAEVPLSAQQELRLGIITGRVKEIKSMDKSHLSRAEKKALKTELKQLKKEAKGMAVGGVFLTVLSLLAVIVLLILLL